jgi:hypothetical protein
MKAAERGSDIPSPFDSAVHSRFIDIFEFTAHRDAISQAGHPDAAWLDQFCQVKGRGISFDSKVCRYENFLNGAIIEAVDQGVDLEVFGSNAVQWRQGSVQYMVAALERPAAFDGQQGLGLFDNAE